MVRKLNESATYTTCDNLYPGTGYLDRFKQALADYLSDAICGKGLYNTDYFEMQDYLRKEGFNVDTEDIDERMPDIETREIRRFVKALVDAWCCTAIQFESFRRNGTNRRNKK